MLGPQQYHGDHFDQDRWQFSDHKTKFVKEMLKGFDTVPEMKDVFTRTNPDNIINHLSVLYKHYTAEGTDNINGLTMVAELYHFAGQRITVPDEVTKKGDELSDFVKKHFAKKKAADLKPSKPVGE